MPQEEIDKRKEKERKREEKELRKIAAASGVKMTKSTLLPSGAPALAPAVNPVVEPKPSGWVNISNSTDAANGFKKAGWATVGSSQTVPAPAGWTTAGSPSSASLSASQSGGWSSLDERPPPLPPANVLMPPPIPPSSSPALALDPPSQPLPLPQHPPSKSHLARVGWQQFQQKKFKK